MRIRVAIALATSLAVAAPASSAPPAHTAAGQSFKVQAPKRGKVSYYLSRDTRHSLEDIRLIGPRGSKVVVPAAPPGSYRLLTCVANRCIASRGQLAVDAGTPTQIVAFGDSKPDETDQNIASSNGLNPTVCPTPVAARKLPSLAGALGAAHAVLARAAGTTGL